MKAKKIMIVLLVLILSFALAACGGSGGSGSAPDTSAPSAAAPDSNAPAAGDTSSEATETLKIGHLVCQSGWFSSIDISNIDELVAYVDLINNDMGGWDIGGKKYKIEMVNSDFQSDPSQARAALEYLADQNLKFVLVSTDFMTIGLGDLWEELGIMHINQMPSEPTFAGPQFPHMFWSRGGVFDGFDAGLQALHNAFPDAKTVVYVQEDNGVNQMINDEFITPAAERLGISVVPTPIIFPNDATDYSAVALAAQRTGADAFVAMGGLPSNAGIVKELRTLGSDMVGALCNPMNIVTFSIVAGEATDLVSCGTLANADENTEVFKQVRAKYEEMFGAESALSFTANSCNSLYILLQMMSIAGTTDVDEVMATWQAQDSIDTMYGKGPVCGEQMMGSKRAVASPPGKSAMKEDGIPLFLGFAETYIP